MLGYAGRATFMAHCLQNGACCNLTATSQHLPTSWPCELFITNLFQPYCMAATSSAYCESAYVPSHSTLLSRDLHDITGRGALVGFIPEEWASGLPKLSVLYVGLMYLLHVAIICAAAFDSRNVFRRNLWGHPNLCTNSPSNSSKSILEVFQGVWTNMVIFSSLCLFSPHLFLLCRTKRHTCAACQRCQ